MVFYLLDTELGVNIHRHREWWSHFRNIKHPLTIHAESDAIVHRIRE